MTHLAHENIQFVNTAQEAVSVVVAAIFALFIITLFIKMGWQR